MNRVTKLRLVAAATCWLVASGVLIVADNGRTPIYELPLTIDEPGSYFLSRDVTGVAGQNGIIINASDVTIDLNGFALIGVPGSLRGTIFREPRCPPGQLAEVPHFTRDSVHRRASGSGRKRCPPQGLREGEGDGFPLVRYILPSPVVTNLL